MKKPIYLEVSPAQARMNISLCIGKNRKSLNKEDLGEIYRFVKGLWEEEEQE